MYAGKVRYKDKVHDGEQSALIDPDTFGRVRHRYGPALGQHNADVEMTEWGAGQFAETLAGQHLERAGSGDRGRQPVGDGDRGR